MYFRSCLEFKFAITYYLPSETLKEQHVIINAMLLKMKSKTETSVDLFLEC